METKQAISVIKQALDKATQSGVFQNLETVVAISQALQFVLDKLQKIENEKSSS